VAQGIAGGAAGRATPITIIIGTAGDRPDDTLRGIGRIAAQRADRVAIKETLKYLRGRRRESVVGEIRAGIAIGRGGSRKPVDDVPVYESETEALRAELGLTGEGTTGGRQPSRIIVLLAHEERDEVFDLLGRLGAHAIDVTAELTSLVPRLQDRLRPA
jgi:hypothetical protein